MGHILTFSMQKGGTAKTTTCENVAVELAKRGARVLCIDLDPDCDLTYGQGVDPEQVEYSVYEVLLNPNHDPSYAIRETQENVFLIPSSNSMDGAELELAGKVGRENLLRKALAFIRDQYDYILIDPPPNLGLFTLNALSAADAVIIPVQLQPRAFRRLNKLEATIELIKRELNPVLTIGGVVGTMHNRTRASQVVEQQLRDRYGDIVFNTVIPSATKIGEAPAFGETISVYAPGSPGAIAYAQLTDEIEERYAFKS
jgi:chromosome partitioning protein